MSARNRAGMLDASSARSDSQRMSDLWPRAHYLTARSTHGLPSATASAMRFAGIPSNPTLPLDWSTSSTNGSLSHRPDCGTASGACGHRAPLSPVVP